MNKIISIKIRQEDLEKINEACQKDRRTRNGFMIVSAIERSEKMLCEKKQ